MANYTHTPTTYEQAREVWRSAMRRRYRPRVKLGHNTYLHPTGLVLVNRNAPAYAVQQHDTDVVTFYRNGVIKLDTGGWLTATTTERLDTFTPDRIRVNAVDIKSRRPDARPRLVVSDVPREVVTRNLIASMPEAGTVTSELPQWDRARHVAVLDYVTTRVFLTLHTNGSWRRALDETDVAR